MAKDSGWWLEQVVDLCELVCGWDSFQQCSVHGRGGGGFKIHGLACMRAIHSTASVQVIGHIQLCCKYIAKCL